jgi:hypothetical protein
MTPVTLLLIKPVDGSVKQVKLLGRQCVAFPGKDTL